VVALGNANPRLKNTFAFKLMIQPQTASLQFTSLIHKLEGQATISVGDLLARLGGASFPFALLMLSVPALIPLPGPFGIAFGTALGLIGLQIISGARRLWLPHWIRKRELTASHIQALLVRVVPWLSWAESHLYPRRYKFLTGITARRILGLPIVMLGFIIALPIPLGNVVPVIACVAFALALLARDGLAVLVAIGLSVVAAIWTVVLVVFGVNISSIALGWF
jgi:hypothetical protein